MTGIKDIPCTPGARRVKAWVAEGEHEHQDFKYCVNDVRKIARSVSAFANNDGGRLLIGVKDNGVIAGIRNEEDAYVVEAAAQTCCTPAVDVSFHTYSVDTAVKVIVAVIARAAQRPVCVREDGGMLRAYYRVKDENIAAHPLMVTVWKIKTDATPLVLGAGHAEMLDEIRRRGSISADLREVAVALQMAERTAALLVAQLACSGAVAFAHTADGFVVVPA